MVDPNLTILLVEDNDIDVLVLQRLLRRQNIDLPIVHVNNGEEALELLRVPVDPPRLAPPYVILLDLNMPRMNGFEFLDELADDPTFAEVPIFILSTSRNVHDQETAKGYRIRGYFVKPIDERALSEVLGTSEPGET